MKMRANFPPPYSTLNPETSSDSPSAKSKGARLVSAKSVTNQAIKRGGTMRARGIECLNTGVEKLNDSNAVRAEIKSKAIEIS